MDLCLCLISTDPASYSIDKKAKFSRKRLNEDEGDITYINERNRVFNKKVWSLCHFQFARPLMFVLDCEILRQIYCRDSGEL